ncbi:alpha/beta-hydrolase, partial [Dentipellis sp. KUC8613]
QTFEPTLRELVRRAEAEAGYRIDEIWLLEAVNQGDSALVNGSRLPTLFDWKDHTRDHLNFFLNYLPETVSAQPLPTLLERVPDAVADARRVRGFPQRKLVAIGHSLGGSTLALAAYYYPALFAGLVLVDPVIAPVGHETHALKIGYASGALSRRETWPSREEAHKLLRASPFFGAWEPEVLKLYVEHGLTPDGSGVRLKTTGFQEAATFADTLTRQEAWTAVGQIDERIPLKWLCAETAAKGCVEIERQRVWLRPENASNARVPGAGHLIVQERPRELGRSLCLGWVVRC